MGADQKFFVQGEDGTFKRLKDEYSITIHFDNQRDMNAFILLLKKINDLKIELPRQQEEKG